MEAKPPDSNANEPAVDESEFQWPLRYMRHEHFKKGEYLFRVGEPAENLFYIAKGMIRLPELGRLLRAGQVIGEIGIFSPNRCRSASALAEEDVDTYTMGSEEVRHLMHGNPSLATKLIEVVLKRMMENIQAETEARERINAELRIARNIQSSMLPREFPPFPGRTDFEIYATMEPASEVGGDFYDFFLVRENKLCVLVGDVSGKGIPAALFMALSKTLLRSEAMRGYSVNDILARVNTALSADNKECMFLTVFCLILDTRTGETEYCSGGHNAPLYCPSSGGIRFLDQQPGPLIGFEEDFRCESKGVQLNRGDLLLLYTDGVTEAENARQEPFSEKRLGETVAGLRSGTLAQIIDGVRSDIAGHVQGHAQSDDITVLALKYNGAVDRAG
jgi:sigma-B regulation protein RsbU (phosphoserine phosphatase)